jgi:stage II sporulation protein AA (anti-sigma F factor antagonist)
MVTVRLSGTIAMLDLTCDLTPEAREEVEAAYSRVNASGVKKIILNFQKDAYINSGGIAIIINIAIAGAKNGQKIRIVQPSEHFQKIFTMVGLRQYVEIFGTEAEALEDF